MTVAQTLLAIKAIPGMTARYRDGEYRVYPTYADSTYTKPEREFHQEAQAYYTDDAEDALVTAHKMAEEARK